LPTYCSVTRPEQFFDFTVYFGGDNIQNGGGKVCGKVLIILSGFKFVNHPNRLISFNTVFGLDFEGFWTD
jgi:hypothetical protein